MKVNFKKLHPDAVLPERQNYGDVGMDLVAVECIKDGPSTDDLWFKTGLAVEIPYGYAGLIYPRSSISKKDLVLANSVGVIDPGYRGEIQVRFKKTRMYDGLLGARFYPYGSGSAKMKNKIYDVGDRVAQLIIYKLPQVETEWVDELSDSERGEGGFGSTGK